MITAQELASWVISDMDRDVLLRVKYLSDTTDIPPHLIVQNILIDHWARGVARYQVEGRGVTNPEFSWEIKPDGTRELITGEKLFYSLVEYYKHESERMKQP